jgi:hypothetical protein
MCNACDGDFYTLSDDVCSAHETWIVTVCQECGKACISYVINTCPPCLSKMPEYHSGFGFNKDHRAPLRKYGLE